MLELLEGESPPATSATVSCACNRTLVFHRLNVLRPNRIRSSSPSSYSNISESPLRSKTKAPFNNSLHVRRSVYYLQVVHAPFSQERPCPWRSIDNDDLLLTSSAKDLPFFSVVSSIRVDAEVSGSAAHAFAQCTCSNLGLSRHYLSRSRVRLNVAPLLASYIVCPSAHKLASYTILYRVTRSRQRVGALFGSVPD